MGRKSISGNATVKAPSGRAPDASGGVLILVAGAPLWIGDFKMATIFDCVPRMLFDFIVEHFIKAVVVPDKKLGRLPIPIPYSDTRRISVHVSTENQQFNVFRSVLGQSATDTYNDHAATPPIAHRQNLGTSLTPCVTRSNLQAGRAYR